MSESGSGEHPVRSWLERVSDLFSVVPTSRRELMQTLKQAGDRSVVDADALNIIFGALNVADMRARDIMVPRSQTVTVRADAPPSEFLPVVIASQHSRFPVIGDDLDDVRGVLHAKDLLHLAIDGADGFNMRDAVRPTRPIPESKRLNVLLQEFRANRNHMAIVVDEYGHMAGIITIEDVLEQIVGEIEDEHDARDDSFIKQLDERSFTIKAVTPLDEFNARFQTGFPEDEHDTIGGVLLSRFGHLPQRDETIFVDGLHFTVLNADSRRIRLLRMTLPLENTL